MDLRQMGSPYEKKYVELTDEDRAKVAATYHTWQTSPDDYEDIPEYCFSAHLEDIEVDGETVKGIKSKGYSLVPSKYIKFINRDEDIDYDTKMKQLQGELTDLLKQEEQSKAELLKVFKELGYEIKL